MKSNSTRGRFRPVSRTRRAGAFSLVELLVVMGIIATLAGILFPALAKATGKARTIQCLGNTRQVALGWLLYAGDHEDPLAPNEPNSYNSWVGGIMSFDYDLDNTNIQKLIDPQYAKLAPYVAAAESYKCPSDRSTVNLGQGRQPRVRSYAMNFAVGSTTAPADLPFSPGWMVYRKLGDIVHPSPARLWLEVEEHPDGIDDGVFVVDCQSQGKSARLISVPANYHDGVTTFSFADGHSEEHRWLDNRTRVQNRYCGCIAHYVSHGFFIDTPNNPDVAWLQAATSRQVIPRQIY
jgi:prepilin-type processing-associated H-X9-DG protein